MNTTINNEYVERFFEASMNGDLAMVKTMLKGQ